MNDTEFLHTLLSAATELQRRADASAGDSETEVSNLILSNAASGLLIALNAMTGTMPKLEILEDQAA